MCQTATVQTELHNWTSINRDSRVSGTSDLSGERSSCMLSAAAVHVSLCSLSVRLFQDCFEDAFDRIPV